MRYAKTIVAAVIAAATAVQLAITDGHVTPAEWVTVTLAVLGVLGVYAVPNGATSTTSVSRGPGDRL